MAMHPSLPPALNRGEVTVFPRISPFSDGLPWAIGTRLHVGLGGVGVGVMACCLNAPGERCAAPEPEEPRQGCHQHNP